MDYDTLYVPALAGRESPELGHRNYQHPDRTRKDFGPMLRAERRARATGQLFRPGSDIEQAEAESQVLVPDEHVPKRAFNAIVPIAVLVVGVLGGLWATGEGENVREIISSADSYKAMMWASLLAVVVAVALSVGQRILTLEEAINAWYAGMKAMLLAIIILVLAWALSGVNDVLGTYLYGVRSSFTRRARMRHNPKTISATWATVM